MAKSGSGSSASALALDDIDKFATKAELAVTFFEDTSAPADPNDIAIIEFDATKLEQLDTQINALDATSLDNFKKMDKDVLDVLAKSGTGSSAARLDITSIDKVAAKAKMAVAVLGPAGDAPIEFDAAKIAQVDTYINAIEDDFLDAIDEIDITNLTNDKDGNAFDITKVDKIASKAAVVKTFTDLGQFDPNAESADFSQFNSLEEDSLDAFLAFEPEQLQNLAKDESGSADLSRLDDIATQAKFTKV